jgi:hypothetical protein
MMHNNLSLSTSRIRSFTFEISIDSSAWVFQSEINLYLETIISIHNKKANVCVFAEHQFSDPFFNITLFVNENSHCQRKKMEKRLSDWEFQYYVIKSFSQTEINVPLESIFLTIQDSGKPYSKTVLFTTFTRFSDHPWNISRPKIVEPSNVIWVTKRATIYNK